jgi:type IV pilus assembly protein PilQ
MNGLRVLLADADPAGLPAPVLLLTILLLFTWVLHVLVMNITLENGSPNYARAAGPNQIPPIDTQRARTTVLVKDGDTTVIGGIYVSEEQAATDATPGLSRIPLLGWLFKRDAVNDSSRELLIFITPRILKM